VSVPFSQALRERTWSSHSDSEGAGFMSDLMKGVGTRDDYIALVVQHFYIYEALEGSEQSFAADAVVAPFATPRLTRLPAIEADLVHLLGDDWRERIEPLPSATAYADRIREIAAEGWAGGFIAHHYTRYLGDLSGGQHIARVMKKRFGLDEGGVDFYVFDEIPDPSEFKQNYRDELDRVAWSDEERERVILEVLEAYRFNTELFNDLARAKAAAA
jgi:heme oxygenase